MAKMLDNLWNPRAKATNQLRQFFKQIYPLKASLSIAFSRYKEIKN